MKTNNKVWKMTKTKKLNITRLHSNTSALYISIALFIIMLCTNYTLKAQTNTAYGTDALKVNTGRDNSAFGYQSLYSNTTGNHNMANGFHVLFSNTTGSSNVANGNYALSKNEEGSENVANGTYAITSNTSGYGNTATGMYGMFLNTTGFNNTANGIDALRSNTIGNNNIALGAYADVGTGNLTNATAIGARAKVMTSNTIQLGDNAITKIYAGVGNTATLVTGGLQVTGGTPAIGKVLTSDASGVATWQMPITGVTSVTGNSPIAIVNGTTTPIISITKANNFTDGYLSSTDWNTFNNKGNGSVTNVSVIGLPLRVSNSATTPVISMNGTWTDGQVADNLTINGGTINNSIIGGTTPAAGTFTTLKVTGGTPAAGKVLTSDANGIASWQIPASTGWGLVGNAGTVDGTHFIGTIDNVPFNIRVNNQKAGRIDKDKGNAFYGYQAGNQNTTGGYNIANGHQAMYNNTTGDGNIAIGYLALNANNTGSYNTAIGYNANTASGSLTNATAIGYGAIVDSSNKIRLGNAMVEKVETQFKYSIVSDGRFKNKISQEDIKGLAFIKKLRPVAYNFDTRKFQEHITQNMPSLLRKQYMNQDFSASTAVRRSGFIAQEVEKAAEEVGYDFDGVSKPQDASGNYSLAYSQFVVPLVKGMQEQQTQIEKQEQKIEQLQKEKEQQQKINEQLQQRLEALEKIIASNNNSAITKDELAKPITGNEVQVYPNPNNGVFNVVVPAGVQKMELIDMKGALLKTIHVDSKTASHQLNLSGYAKGMYILQVVVNGKTQTSKVLVQ